MATGICKRNVVQVIREQKAAYAQKKAENKPVIDVNDGESELYVVALITTNDNDETRRCISHRPYRYLEKRLKVFLDTLLELNDAGANFSHDEIRDEVVTMMIGVSIYNMCACVRNAFNDQMDFTGQRDQCHHCVLQSIADGHPSRSPSEYPAPRVTRFNIFVYVFSGARCGRVSVCPRTARKY